MSYGTLQKQATTLTQRQINSYSRNIAEQYRIAMNTIISQIDALYERYLTNANPDDYFEIVSRQRRLFSRLQQVERQYLRHAEIANLNIEQASRTAFINEFYRRQYVNSWFTPIGNQAIILQFAAIDPIAVDLSVYSTTARWNAMQNQARKSALSGFVPQGDRPTLKQLILSNDRLAVKRIGDTITQGLILGKSNQQMASDIRKTFGKIGRNANRIVRTETHRNMSAALYANRVMMEEQGVTARRQILSTLDSRTRAQSAAVDGRIDDADGYFTYPNGVLVKYPGNSGIARWDINDRETTIELVDGVGPRFRSGRNPNTGEIEVAEFEDFYTWANRNGLERNKFGEYVAQPQTATTQ